MKNTRARLSSSLGFPTHVKALRKLQGEVYMVVVQEHCLGAVSHESHRSTTLHVY